MLHKIELSSFSWEFMEFAQKCTSSNSVHLVRDVSSHKIIINGEIGLETRHICRGTHFGKSGTLKLDSGNRIQGTGFRVHFFVKGNSVPFMESFHC